MRTITTVHRCDSCGKTHDSFEKASACSTTPKYPVGCKYVVKDGILWRISARYGIDGEVAECTRAFLLDMPRQFQKHQWRYRQGSSTKTVYANQEDNKYKALTVEMAGHMITAIEREIDGYQNSIKDAEGRKRFFEKFIKENK